MSGFWCLPNPPLLLTAGKSRFRIGLRLPPPRVILLNAHNLLSQRFLHNAQQCSTPACLRNSTTHGNIQKTAQRNEPERSRLRNFNNGIQRRRGPWASRTEFCRRISVIIPGARWSRTVNAIVSVGIHVNVEFVRGICVWLGRREVEVARCLTARPGE